jgi:hypothetical protein
VRKALFEEGKRRKHSSNENLLLLSTRERGQRSVDGQRTRSACPSPPTCPKYFNENIFLDSLLEDTYHRQSNLVIRPLELTTHSTSFRPARSAAVVLTPSPDGHTTDMTATVRYLLTTHVAYVPVGLSRYRSSPAGQQGGTDVYQQQPLYFDIYPLSYVL